MNIGIITLPLISALFILITGRYIGIKGGRIISIGSIGGSTIISIKNIIEEIRGRVKIINIQPCGNDWIETGIYKIKIELIYDKESIIMNGLISIITLIVIIFSYWYLKEDAGINRFISYLLLFSVGMFILVTGKNYMVTFIGWEIVGIISYLLINYWYNSINNNKSAIKAIIINKIGDLCYLFGICLLLLSSKGLDYNVLNISENNIYINLILFSFIIAAVAKSAQIFGSPWLGDAMAGPTPVSALLHAATMVTAGIILLLRTRPFMDSIDILYLSDIIGIIGTITILFAGLVAITQYDIKKIIAYSTCSQIGYMFFIISIQKPEYSSLYHLITHGFFKALLFISAGLIIHSFLLSPEQDIRKFGNLIFSSPIFYLFFLIGTFAILGIPVFSGYYSKDLIILHSLNPSSHIPSLFSYFILILGSVLSSIYSLRLLFYSFYNNNYSNPLYSSSSISLFYIFFIFLLFLGSIFIGLISSSYFTSLEFINLDLEFSLFSEKTSWILLPLFLPFILFLLFFLYYSFFSKSSLKLLPFLWNIKKRVITIFNKRFFFDSFYNFFFVLPFFSFSYHLSYKFLDRGFLEFLGPLSFFRLLFWSEGFLPLKSEVKFSDYSYYFIYFFISLILPSLLLINLLG